MLEMLYEVRLLKVSFVRSIYICMELIPYQVEVDAGILILRAKSSVYMIHVQCYTLHIPEYSIMWIYFVHVYYIYIHL